MSNDLKKKKVRKRKKNKTFWYLWGDFVFKLLICCWSSLYCQIYFPSQVILSPSSGRMEEKSSSVWACTSYIPTRKLYVYHCVSCYPFIWAMISRTRHFLGTDGHWADLRAKEGIAVISFSWSLAHKETPKDCLLLYVSHNSHSRWFNIREWVKLFALFYFMCMEVKKWCKICKQLLFSK